MLTKDSRNSGISFVFFYVFVKVCSIAKAKIIPGIKLIQNCDILSIDFLRH